MSKLRVDELESLTTGKSILVDEIDSGVRADLDNPDKGALLVSGAVIYVDTISELQALPSSELVDGQQVIVKEYHSGAGVGGGVFRWDSSSIADVDNGIIFGDVNETGRWIRITQGERTKAEWYAPVPVTDGARFIANSTNKDITYSKDNSYYKKLLFKIEKPFAEIKAHYPNIGSTTQKCFIEWDRGIFWMSFFSTSPDNRMVIAAVDIITGSLLTVTAVSSVSICFEIVKEGASRKLYVHQGGSLRYIDVTTLPPIGVDSVATEAPGLENVGYYCTYYNKRWYSFEKTTREEVAASDVKVYRLDGTLERGFAIPQLIVNYGTARKYASKHQSIRLINGEVVFAVGAGSRYTKLLEDGAVYTAANRQAFYQGLIRYSPQNNQQTSSLVDPLAYKDKFGFDELVEVQDVTPLAGGGLATIVNDDTYVYVIEEFANSADINSVNLSDYQSVLPNVYNIPFNRIIQPAANFGIKNFNSTNLIDIYTLEEITTWRGIVDKMIQYGVEEATIALNEEIVLNYWFDDSAVNIPGRAVLSIRLRGNSNVFIEYTNYRSLALSKNIRFKISGAFFIRDTVASGLVSDGTPMIERFDTATKQMLYSTDFSDPVWEGLPFYTGV